jgi:hypothetical protein
MTFIRSAIEQFPKYVKEAQIHVPETKNGQKAQDVHYSTA